MLLVPNKTKPFILETNISLEVWEAVLILGKTLSLAIRYLSSKVVNHWVKLNTVLVRMLAQDPFVLSLADALKPSVLRY